MPYGNSDVVSNPEVKAAYGDGQYVIFRACMVGWRNSLNLT